MIVESPAAHHAERTQTITAIVIHDSNGFDLKELLQLYAETDSKQSIHYVINSDGGVIRCVPDARKAFHIGPTGSIHGQRDVDNFSIGVTLITSEIGGEKYNVEQFESLITLVAQLARDYKIPLNMIVGHDFVENASDPGESFPWFEFLNSVGSIVAQEDITDAIDDHGVA